MQAWRRLWRRPGTSLISVLVLGVALGVVTFQFNLVQKTILQPLPFPHPDRLVVFGHANDSGIGIGTLNNALLLTLKGKLDGLDAAGAYGASSVVLGGGGHAPAAYELGGRLTASAMRMLDPHALLGRGLVPADDAPGAPPVVVLGESLWRQRYHADPHILGRSLRVDGTWAKVVGVLSKGFKFPYSARLWMPLKLRDGHDVQVRALARLKPGATLGQLRAQLHALQPHLEDMTRGANRARRLTAKPLALAVIHEDIRRWVRLMFLACLLVLVLACVNASNLQLVQVLNRRHELALRSTLGCSRARLMLDALAEGAWLGLGAVLVAWPIFLGAAHWLAQLYADNGKMVESSFIRPQPDTGLTAFILLAAFLTTTLVVLVPVWRISRGNLQAALSDGSRGSGAGFARVARVLVVVEIALTVVLLVGAGSLIRSLQHILDQPVSTRVPARQVLTANLAFPRDVNANRDLLVSRYRRIVEQLRQDPAVRDASASNAIPDVTDGSDEYIAAQGRPRPPMGWTHAGMGIVDTHFLSTYGIPLLEGRFFNARDDVSSTPVTVIDSTTAARLWPGRDPVGQKLVLHPEASSVVLTVVGVYKPIRLSGPFVPPQPELLIPLRQAAQQSPVTAVGLAVHTRAADARGFAMHLRRQVAQVAPDVAVYQLFTQAGMERMQRVGVQVLVQFFGFLGLIALCLAAAGLYGVLAFSVARRTREIGIRRAIGAGHGAIVRSMARQLLWQLALGLAIGLALAWPWSSVLAASALPVQAHDPLVFGLTVAVVVLAVALATLLPLHRALRVDPAVALRYE